MNNGKRTAATQKDSTWKGTLSDAQYIPNKITIYVASCIEYVIILIQFPPFLIFEITPKIKPLPAIIARKRNAEANNPIKRLIGIEESLITASPALPFLTQARTRTCLTDTTGCGD